MTSKDPLHELMFQKFLNNASRILTQLPIDINYLTIVNDMTQLSTRNIVTFNKGAFQLSFQLKIQKIPCVRNIK